MKKKEAAHEDKKKHEEADLSEDSSRKYVIIGVGLLIALFLAVVGVKYLYNPLPVTDTGSVIKTDIPKPETDAQSYSYNGYNFIRKDGMWRTEVRSGNTRYDVELYFSPNELKDIPVSGSIGNAFKAEQYYITFDPEDENLTFVALSIAQLDTSLIKSFGKELIAACSSNASEDCDSRPIVSCDTPHDIPVFFVKEDDAPSVSIGEDCTVIKGKGWELVKAAERFLLKAYKIMP
jgi:hypothetical protein